MSDTNPRNTSTKIWVGLILYPQEVIAPETIIKHALAGENIK